MTKRIHTNGNYTTVGMLQVINEPVHGSSWTNYSSDMIENFYPEAYTRIQDMEDDLGIAGADRVHVQFMVRQ